MSTSRLDAAYKDELRHILGDPGRLEAVYDTAFLAQELQEQLDQILILARNITQAPFAGVNLLYEREIFVLSVSGDAPEEGGSVVEAGGMQDVDESFCQHTAYSGKPLLIEDSLEHPLVRHSAWAQQVRSYLGVPLWINGHCIGTLCVTDTLPKQFNTGQIVLLAQCAALVQALIERRSDESS